MKYGTINAAILGCALVISVVIVFGRISLANRVPKANEVAAAPAPPSRKSPESAETAPPSPSPEKTAIAEIQKLLRSADTLSASSIGVEERELELKEAKRSLDRARELLEKLPGENEEVKKLKNALQELTNRILKGSGFDG